MSSAQHTPRATYRLQLHPGFDFDRAAEILDYVAELGITHCYFAPYLTATRGSSHGYDVVDPTRVREDLGGEAGLARLCAALSARGLEQMVDVVPNHMGVDSDENAWWWDVLEQGRASPFARFFDIDWYADSEHKLVLPILPCEEQAALSNGHLRLGRDGEGRTVLFVGTRALPLRAGSLDGTGNAQLERINANPEVLRGILTHQYYRLCYWRTGLGRINYRRFLDISSLAAMRVEDASVFQATHQRIIEWVRAGKVSAIRVDHPDGLTDPEGYFRALRSAAPSAWIVGEKVLSPGEWLPENWAVDGTTGYEFLNLVNGLFVNPRAARTLDDVLEGFTGRAVTPFEQVCEECKALAIEMLLVPEVERVTRLVAQHAAMRGLVSDFAKTRAAVSALVLALDVGRTYAKPGDELSASELAAMERAQKLAVSRNPELEHVINHVVQQIVTPPVDELCLRFQQLSSAAMAKGAEDTALYRYLRLTSLNELGGNPGRFGTSLREFHQFCQRATVAQPLSLLCSSTHDTKRAEDTRLRINVISEAPEAWLAALQRFHALNAELVSEIDRETEYLLYQTLVGTWPISRERLSAYMLKATREAKTHTSWLTPDARYENALHTMIERVLGNADFIRALDDYLAPVLAAARVHSLTQTLLKVTCPGIPDVYQGTELWDTSLVDPDNRRPVDFEKRKALLAELKRGLRAEDIMAREAEGLPKLWVLYSALSVRAERCASLVPTAAYEPIGVSGDAIERIIAFLRGPDVLVVAQRFVQLAGGPTRATLQIPEGKWKNRLTGEVFAGGQVALDALLARFPVALLVRE